MAELSHFSEDAGLARLESYEPAAASPVWHRLCEALAVPAVLALVGLLGLRLLAAVDGPGAAAWGLVGAFAGWLAADFVSGLVHWWADQIASEDFPLLGPSFVRPFREHHESPAGICQHGFVRTNGNTCVAVLPFLVLACLAGSPELSGALACLALAFFLSLVLWSCLTNQIHKWAHQPEVPGAVRCLQRAGVLLSHEHHAGHHAAPYASHYCITTGWLDPLLDGWGFFHALERRLGRSPGVRPERRSA